MSELKIETILSYALTGANISEPIVEVKHSDLQRFGKGRYKCYCPVCERGLLLVRRHPRTFILEELDYCLLCAQRITYLDIDVLRKED